MQKEVVSIEPLSTAKIGALLGILWAMLGWFFNGLILITITRSAEQVLPDLPSPFSFAGLLSGIIGGFIGGGISGYLGCTVYNLLAKRIGGIRATVKDVADGTV